MSTDTTRPSHRTHSCTSVTKVLAWVSASAIFTCHHRLFKEWTVMLLLIFVIECCPRDIARVYWRQGSSLGSSSFRFLLAVEHESRGEVARIYGARAKKLERGAGVGRKGIVPNFFVPGVPVPSRDSRLPERKRKRLLRRLAGQLCPNRPPDCWFGLRMGISEYYYKRWPYH